MLQSWVRIPILLTGERASVIGVSLVPIACLFIKLESILGEASQEWVKVSTLSYLLWCVCQEECFLVLRGG